MKKKLYISLALGTFLLLAGCSGGKETAELQMIVSGDTNEGSAYQKMAEKYEKETGTVVEVVDVPYNDLVTRITSAVQADNPPALARVSNVDPSWKDSLLDLQKIADEKNITENLVMSDDEGIVRALPSDLTAVGLFINTDLFKEAGVDYPKAGEEPWTWDEFLKGLDTVLDKTDARYGMVMDASDHRLRAFTYQFGSKDFFLDEDGEYTTNPETIEALKKFIALNDNETMPKSVWTSGEDPSAMFKSGQVAAYMSGVWQVTDFSENIANFEWASVYMPYETVRATNLGGNFNIAFDGSGHEEEAIDFLEWIYTKENYEELASYAGYLPVIDEAEVDYGDNQEAINIYLDEMEASDPISSKQMTEQIDTQLSGKQGLTGVYADVMKQVLNDEISLDEAIEKIKQDYENGNK